MTDSSAEPEGVGDFLEIHYEKFAIMGIFGTVTVFLNQQWLGDPSSLSTHLATVASLLIFGLASIWIAGKAFSEISPDGDLPDYDDIGYVLISLCTGILGIVMIKATSLYSVALQIVGELAISVIVVLLYIRFTNILAYYHGDSSLDELDTSGAVALAGLFSMLVLGLYGDTVISLTENSLQFKPILFVPLVISFIVIHYIFTEGCLGLMSIVGTLEKQDSVNWKSTIRQPWSIRESLTLALTAVSLVTIHATNVAESAVGPNYGYYRVLNIPSIRFTLFHWVGLLFGFLIIVYLDRNTEIPTDWLKRSGQGIAALSVLILLIDVLFLVPRGQHVIPLG